MTTHPQEHASQGLSGTSAKRNGDSHESVLDRFLAFFSEPAVVGVVESSSASEADIDDFDLMDYYATHPETDRDDSLAELVALSE